MSLEMVREIKDAEAQADMIKKDAVARAKQIALDTHKACEILMNEAKSKAEVQRSEALKSADSVADQEGILRREKVAAQCEAIKKSASVRIDRAVDIVVDRIVRD